MKPYVHRNWVQSSSVPMFILGVILFAVLTGAAAYFVSLIFYIFILFAFGVVVLIFLWGKFLIEKLQVHHVPLAAVMGVVAGILVVWTYHFIPFMIERNDFIQMVVNEYQVTEYQAGLAFRDTLIQETGLPGLLGFLKFNARNGQEYTGFLVFGSVPMELGFSLTPFLVWLNWIVEAGIILVAAVLIFKLGVEEPFNFSDKSEYDSLLRLTAVRRADEDRFLQLIEEDHLSEAIQFVVSVNEVEYPHLDVSVRVSQGKKGGGLMQVRDIWFNEKGKMKSELAGRWELNKEELAFYEEYLDELYPEE